MDCWQIRFNCLRCDEQPNAVPFTIPNTIPYGIPNSKSDTNTDCIPYTCVHSR
jgi:hypothetical protein